MTTGGSRARPPLLGGLSYFEYQRRVAHEALIPWLSGRLDLTGIRVGDFGAHHGGMLEAFREAGVVDSAIGLELRDDVVASSPFVADDRFRLEVADLTTLDPGHYEFDLVILHDVLEHVPDHGSALEAVCRSLAPNGHVFVSFPPYYSGFGGHQQLARGRARAVPFIHLLPRALFFRLAAPAEQEYMDTESSLDDMVSVRATKLTLRKAERAFAEAGLEVTDRELFVVRPEYTIRYGLKARRAGVAGRLPIVRELAVNGAQCLLRRVVRDARIAAPTAHRSQEETLGQRQRVLELAAGCRGQGETREHGCSVRGP
ncbi:MAG TPA: methyltransferase domain-containing protein [Gaiellaceae bacterium]|nr:methyltransferase domain-containing protein [Gaiellaceae bacterium]